MTIGEFSKITGISCSALRYYEEKGLIKVKRDLGNRRMYSDDEIEWVKFLQKLKFTGMSLEKMKTYSDLRYRGDSTIDERLNLLKGHKEYVKTQLEKWREYDENLDAKIDLYKEKLKSELSK